MKGIAVRTDGKALRGAERGKKEKCNDNTKIKHS